MTTPATTSTTPSSCSLSPPTTTPPHPLHPTHHPHVYIPHPPTHPPTLLAPTLPRWSATSATPTWSTTRPPLSPPASPWCMMTPGRSWRPGPAPLTSSSATWPTRWTEGPATSCIHRWGEGGMMCGAGVGGGWGGGWGGGYNRGPWYQLYTQVGGGVVVVGGGSGGWGWCVGDKAVGTKVA
jgi:hypothetical protein